MSEQIQIRILSVDDHPFVRAGIARVIDCQPDMVIIAEAATGRDAIEQFRQYTPDVILLDIRLPDISGIEVLKTLRAAAICSRARHRAR
jgi:DNA-binding NarL/FixJ family response regulator